MSELDNEARLAVAEALVALVAKRLIAADHEELLRVADSPAYRVGAELRAMLAKFANAGESPA
jgi:hypothetical protein